MTVNRRLDFAAVFLSVLVGMLIVFSLLLGSVPPQNGAAMRSTLEGRIDVLEEQQVQQNEHIAELQARAIAPADSERRMTRMEDQLENLQEEIKKDENDRERQDTQLWGFLATTASGLLVLAVHYLITQRKSRLKGTV